MGIIDTIYIGNDKIGFQILECKIIELIRSWGPAVNPLHILWLKDQKSNLRMQQKLVYSGE